MDSSKIAETGHRGAGELVAAAVLCVAVVSGGCEHGRASGAPSWTSGVTRDYPSEQYLIGVGEGESPAVAAERAYAAVARVFKAEISAQSRDWESYLLLESKGTQNTERRLTLDQVTRVSTEKVLENVSLLETWSDRTAGQHYAMAGMQRAQAEQGLLERIAQLDQSIEMQLKESREAPYTLTKVRNLHRALKSLLLREAYNADLRIIRTSGRGTEAPYQVAALASQLEQFLTANVLIAVEVTGEQSEPVRRAITEGLLREGLPVISGSMVGGRRLELLVKGTVQFRDMDVPDKQFRYVRWCSDVLIVEPASDRILGAVSKSGREGHLTAGEARAKAARVMQQEISADLAKALAGYVYGEVDPPTALPPAACPREGRGQSSVIPPTGG
jgi:hypothetical protein